MKAKIILHLVKFVFFLVYYLGVAAVFTHIDDKVLQFVLAFLAGYVWHMIDRKFDYLL